METSTAGGLRSGRERKAHTPCREEDPDDPDATTRPGYVGWLVVTGLALEARFADSQPVVFAKAKYVAPAPTAARKRRRVNLLPIAKLCPIKRPISRMWFPDRFSRTSENSVHAKFVASHFYEMGCMAVI